MYEIIAGIGLFLGIAGAVALFIVNFRNTEVKQTINNLQELANSQKKRMDDLSDNYDAAEEKIKKLETTIAEIKDIPLKRMSQDYQAIARTFARIETHMKTTNQILQLILQNTPQQPPTTVVNVDSKPEKK